jgi:outer membrane protein TolC
VTKSFSLSSALTQEIDVWGRLAQSAAVAYQNAAIAQTDLDAARWLLTAKVAEQYWTVAATDAKMVLAKQATKDAQINLEVIQLRLATGKIRPAEVDRSTLALEQAQQKEVALALQRSNTVQTLALLLDDAPQNLSVPQARLPSSLPTEPQAWPAAAVVDRLPAVRRSRLALDVAARNLNIAESNRYPQFSLSATASASGDSLSNVLSNPLGSLGLNLGLPMVDWKRLRINRDVSQVDLDIAAVDFRETLYKALSEVDQQYNQRRQWVSDNQSLQLKSAQAEQALAVAQLRYEVGAEPLQTVRDAQANLRDLETNRIDLQLKAWNNQINIFKAWGGPLGGAEVVTPTSAASASP